MPLMESKEDLVPDAEALEKLHINNDRADTGVQQGSDKPSYAEGAIPPTPVAEGEQTNQQRPPPPPPRNGSARITPNPPSYGNQPRQSQARGQQALAPRQLPPYVCFPGPAGQPLPSRSQGTGWGGMPFNPSGSGNGSGHADREHSGSLGNGNFEDGAHSDGNFTPTSEDSEDSQNGLGGTVRSPIRTACAFFLKTGSCAYGDRCKFEHPFDKAPKVQYNTMGLPLRPEEPPCAYFMKHLHCAFGHTCKFHHPELSPAQPEAAVVIPGPPPPAQLVYAGVPAMAQQFYSTMQYQQMQQMGRMGPMPAPMAAVAYYPQRMGGLPPVPGGQVIYPYAPHAPATGVPAQGMHPRGQQGRYQGMPSGPVMNGGPPPVRRGQTSSMGGSPPTHVGGGGGISNGPRSNQGMPSGHATYNPKPLMVFNSPVKPEEAA